MQRAGRNHCVNKHELLREKREGERLFSPLASGQVSHQQGGECFCAENLSTKGSKASLRCECVPLTILLPGKYKSDNGNARNGENLCGCFVVQVEIFVIAI